MIHEACGQPHSENEEIASFTKGQTVMYKGEKYIVEVPDAQSNFVGIIPDELAGSSEEKRAIGERLSQASNHESELEDLFWALLNSNEFIFNH